MSDTPQTVIRVEPVTCVTEAEARRREREAVAWTLTELTREHALPLGVASLNAEAFAAALNGRYPEVIEP